VPALRRDDGEGPLGGERDLVHLRLRGHRRMARTEDRQEHRPRADGHRRGDGRRHRPAGRGASRPGRPAGRPDAHRHRRGSHEPCTGTKTAERARVSAEHAASYARRKPELGTLHQVVRENLLTLYTAAEQGFESPVPAFVRDELEGYVACGAPARGRPSTTLTSAG
jgi:hypothetical protein